MPKETYDQIVNRLYDDWLCGRRDSVSNELSKMKNEYDVYVLLIGLGARLFDQGFHDYFYARSSFKWVK